MRTLGFLSGLNLATSCDLASAMRHLERFSVFTITAEIHARSLANLYCQYADRHINLKFMQRISERERATRQFVTVMSVCNASVLLLTMKCVITLSK